MSYHKILLGLGHDNGSQMLDSKCPMAVHPISGVACVRTSSEAANQWVAMDSLWVTPAMIHANLSDYFFMPRIRMNCEAPDQRVAMDSLRATYLPTTIRMGLPVYVFVPQNWVNVSLRVFTVDKVISSAQLGATLPFDVQVTLPARFRVIDGVISSAQLGATLPFDVQVNLPACFWVNLYTALWVNRFVTPLWVNDRVILLVQVWDILPIDVQVILPACFWVNKFATPLWVNDSMISPF